MLSQVPQAVRPEPEGHRLSSLSHPLNILRLHWGRFHGFIHFSDTSFPFSTSPN